MEQHRTHNVKQQFTIHPISNNKEQNKPVSTCHCRCCYCLLIFVHLFCLFLILLFLVKGTRLNGIAVVGIFGCRFFKNIYVLCTYIVHFLLSFVTNTNCVLFEHNFQFFFSSFLYANGWYVVHIPTKWENGEKPGSVLHTIDNTLSKWTEIISQ